MFTGKHVRDYLKSLEHDPLGTQHAGLSVDAPISGNSLKPAKVPSQMNGAMDILLRQPHAPARAPMGPEEAPELWRFEHDREYRSAMINEVLMGFPSQEQLAARLSRIKGTEFEKSLINDEVLMAMSNGGLEPGSTVDLDANPELSPLSWGNGSPVVAERDRMRMLITHPITPVRSCQTSSTMQSLVSARSSRMLVLLVKLFDLSLSDASMVVLSSTKLVTL
jgi:hypothetical protein